MDLDEARMVAFKSLVKARTALNYTGDHDLEEEAEGLKEQLRERMEESD